MTNYEHILCRMSVGHLVCHVPMSLTHEYTYSMCAASNVCRLYQNYGIAHAHQIVLRTISSKKTLNGFGSRLFFFSIFFCWTSVLYCNFVDITNPNQSNKSKQKQQPNYICCGFEIKEEWRKKIKETPLINMHAACHELVFDKQQIILPSVIIIMICSNESFKWMAFNTCKSANPNDLPETIAFNRHVCIGIFDISCIILTCFRKLWKNQSHCFFIRILIKFHRAKIRRSHTNSV